MAAPEKGMKLGMWCDGCGSDDVEGLDEHGLSYCLLCLKRQEGYDEGRQDTGELMLHIAIAGARTAMSDTKVRRVFESVMAGGEPMIRVDGVGS